MTTVDGRHTLDREAERLAYKPPEVRHDKQGDMGSKERIDKAMWNFLKNFNTQTASYLDGCLHCGMCADACHFHVRTDDPQYTPIWKIELF
ncbi:MAG: (Fe-S)-binding protein, partial [Gammaproteobacteria bacterium]|nr:(Fe-S)-binding protein [Gammaproteobacteria bacterium]